MRTTWRATCLSLMVLGPLLTACGDDDTATETAATSPAAPTTGVYGQPDPDVEVPTEVATDPPAPTTSPTAAPEPEAARTAVTPRLTYFGWNADIDAVEAGGIVPVIVESDGTCTLTLTRAGTTVDASSTAIDNVTSTACSEMLVPGDRLSPGAWRAVLTYDSATAQGTSEAVEIDVP